MVHSEIYLEGVHIFPDLFDEGFRILGAGPFTFVKGTLNLKKKNILHTV